MRNELKDDIEVLLDFEQLQTVKVSISGVPTEVNYPHPTCKTTTASQQGECCCRESGIAPEVVVDPFQYLELMLSWKEALIPQRQLCGCGFSVGVSNHPMRTLWGI